MAVIRIKKSSSVFSHNESRLRFEPSIPIYYILISRKDLSIYLECYLVIIMQHNHLSVESNRLISDCQSDRTVTRLYTDQPSPGIYWDGTSQSGSTYQQDSLLSLLSFYPVRRHDDTVAPGPSPPVSDLARLRSVLQRTLEILEEDNSFKTFDQ